AGQQMVDVCLSGPARYALHQLDAAPDKLVSQIRWRETARPSVPLGRSVPVFHGLIPFGEAVRGRGADARGCAPRNSTDAGPRQLKATLLQRLGYFNELVQCRTPTFVESHLFMGGTALRIFVNGDGRVLCART